MSDNSIVPQLRPTSLQPLSIPGARLSGERPGHTTVPVEESQVQETHPRSHHTQPRPYQGMYIHVYNTPFTMCSVPQHVLNFWNESYLSIALLHVSPPGIECALRTIVLVYTLLYVQHQPFETAMYVYIGQFTLLHSLTINESNCCVTVQSGIKCGVLCNGGNTTKFTKF